MLFTVVGAGYVGLSLAVLISRKYKVIVLDTDRQKVDLINKRISPFKDKEIEKFFSGNEIDLIATDDKKYAYGKSDYILVATPTNYNIETDSFDTSSVKSVINEALKENPNASIIIKSTVPLGFTDEINKINNTNNIIFSPEFLREGKALYDNLYPSRIVIGGKSETSKNFAELILECSEKNSSNLRIHHMSSKEAEAVKLFSNTYLAMRISFFNELDTFAEAEKISSKKVIEAVSGDNRIGNYYNNPSFGYGGYCLPKDTKQLLSNFQNIPNSLIKAVIESNKIRKQHISSSIINRKIKAVGVYRLAMKMESENFRESAVLDIITELQMKGIKIYLYEPYMRKCEIYDVELVKNLEKFINKSDLIIANRLTDEILVAKDKIYTRDIFREN